MTKANSNGAVPDSQRSMQQRAEGPAAMLAIGTANPSGAAVPQDEFADNFFRATKSEHLPELKEKLKRICKRILPPFPTTLIVPFPLKIIFPNL
jgi:hypothetical protein